MSYKALDKHKIPCSNLTLPTIKLSKKKKKDTKGEVPTIPFLPTTLFFSKNNPTKKHSL